MTVADPCFSAQLCYLESHSSLQVDSFRKESSSSVDRFTVSVPCFLDVVRWDVIFHSQNPSWAPDVVFGNDSGFQPLVRMSKPNENQKLLCSILKNWNVSDPAALHRLLMALRTLYIQYQRKRVMAMAGSDPRLRFEVDTMRDFEGLEMGLVDGPEVVFSLPLREADLSSFEALWPTLEKFDDIYLEVRYPVQNSKQVSSAFVPRLKLHAPPVLKDVFDVQLPIWHDKMCLMEYVPKLQAAVTSQARDAITSIETRRSLLQAMPLLFGRPLETDTLFWKKVLFLNSAGVFVFLVEVLLPISFPKSQPTLALHSTQHFDTHGRPLSRSYDDYPWSPRWETEEMAQRICDFVTQETMVFKKFCSETLQNYHQSSSLSF